MARLNLPLYHAIDSSGNVIAGAKLNFYETLTSTPLDTFSDSALSVANANPVVADSAGRFGDIFLKSQDYKIVYTDAADVTIKQWDPVGPETVADFFQDISGGLLATGSSNAYVVTTNQTITALAAGQRIAFIANFTNTAAVTLAVDGLVAKDIKKKHDLALASGDIEQNQIVDVAYKATEDVWQMLSQTATVAGLPRGHLSGCKLSNNGTDATNDIDISEGECRAVEATDDIALASAITKKLDVTWSVGTDQGGLDTGAIANDTYHVWLIKRSDTGVVDVLFSLSASAPTMPANYDLKRRIGSILRESAAIVAFSQSGDEFLRSVPISDVNETAPGSASELKPLSVPVGVKVEAIVSWALIDTATQRQMFILSPDQANTTPTTTIYDIGLGSSGGRINSRLRTRTNTSGQVRRVLSGSGAGTTVQATTHGWVDGRGRDD